MWTVRIDTLMAWTLDAKVTGLFFSGSIFVLPPFSNACQILSEEFAPVSTTKIFTFRVDLFRREANRNARKLFPFLKMAKERTWQCVAFVLFSFNVLVG